MPGKSLVYLEQMTEEANERARIAAEALLVENINRRYYDWTHIPEQLIVEQEEKAWQLVLQQRDEEMREMVNKKR